MKNLCLFALGFLFYLNPLLGVVQTETHCYIVSPSENKLLIVDRQTGEEKILEIGNSPHPIIIYKDKGFIPYDGSCFLSVIDLNVNEICGQIDFDTCTHHFCIHGNYGYVYEWRRGHWCVVDLTTLKIIKRFDLNSPLNRHFFYKNVGYFWSTSSPIICVVDLKTHTVLKTVKMRAMIHNIYINGDCAYVLCFNQLSVEVIDLEKQILATSIDLKTVVTSLVFHQDRIYAFGSEHSSLYVIDQASHKVLNDRYLRRYMCTLIPLRQMSYVLCGFDLYMVDLLEGKMPYGAPCTLNRVKKLDFQTYFLKTSYLHGIFRAEVKEPHQCCDRLNPQIEVIIHDGRAYMPTYDDKVIVVDIKSNKEIAEFACSRNLHIECSDTHIYAGVTKLCALEDRDSLSLFDCPYQGIMGSWEEDGEEAFNRFAQVFFAKDAESSKSHLKRALACGHRKAYAIAAYAFLHGKFGAKDDQNHWWLQFMAFSDEDTFRKMSTLGLRGVLYSNLNPQQKKNLLNGPLVVYARS